MTCLDNNHQSACTLSQPSVFKFSLLRYPIFSIAVFQTCIPFFKPFITINYQSRAAFDTTFSLIFMLVFLHLFTEKMVVSKSTHYVVGS